MNLDVIHRQFKEILKQKGISQDQFAKDLQISRSTLKRWLNGKNLGLAEVVRMAEMLDLKLSELFAKAEGEAAKHFQYTMRQEQMLANSPGTLPFFDLLLAGFSVEQIKKQHQIGDRTARYHLARLDKIGLLRWLPGDRIKLLVSGEPHWLKNGPLAKQFRQKAIEAHIEQSLSSNSHLRVSTYRLSVASQLLIEEKINRLIDDLRIRELADSTLKQPARSYSLLLNFMRYDFDFLSHIPRREG